MEDTYISYSNLMSEFLGESIEDKLWKLSFVLADEIKEVNGEYFYSPELIKEFLEQWETVGTVETVEPVGTVETVETRGSSKKYMGYKHLFNECLGKRVNDLDALAYSLGEDVIYVDGEAHYSHKTILAELEKK